MEKKWAEGEVQKGRLLGGMRFELTLEIFRTLESNNVKTLWLEGEYGNQLGVIMVAYSIWEASEISKCGLFQIVETFISQYMEFGLYLMFSLICLKELEIFTTEK